MGVRFGTDGIRGVANAELGAGARPRPRPGHGPCPPGASRSWSARDTRRSGPLLQAALSAGLASEGADVVDLGVLPTPAVAWQCAARQLPGAVISASHNPFADNGVKLFAAGGLKLPDAGGGGGRGGARPRPRPPRARPTVTDRSRGGPAVVATPTPPAATSTIWSPPSTGGPWPE